MNNSVFGKLLPIAVLLLWVLTPRSAEAQGPKCFVLCEPDVKVEPTFSWENLFKAPRIAETDDQGNTVIQRAPRERVFETVIAVGVPTTIPRTSFTFEVSSKGLRRSLRPSGTCIGYGQRIPGDGSRATLTSLISTVLAGVPTIPTVTPTSSILNSILQCPF